MRPSLNVTPIPVDQLNLELPVAFAEIVIRLLEKDRELKYQTASDLRSELQPLGFPRWPLDPIVADRSERQRPDAGGTSGDRQDHCNFTPKRS